MGLRVAADGALVHVTQVGEVHQVVDEQHEVALDVVVLRLVRPVLVVVVPGIGNDGRGIGLRRIAGPDPEELVLLDERIALHARARRDAVLAGDVDALAAAVEHQAVVAALQALGDHLAARERSAAVRAAVLERRGFAVGVAEQMVRASGFAPWTSCAQAAMYQSLRISILPPSMNDSIPRDSGVGRRNSPTARTMFRSRPRGLSRVRNGGRPRA